MKIIICGGCKRIYSILLGPIAGEKCIFLDKACAEKSTNEKNKWCINDALVFLDYEPILFRQRSKK